MIFNLVHICLDNFSFQLVVSCQNKHDSAILNVRMLFSSTFFFDGPTNLIYSSMPIVRSLQRQRRSNKILDWEIERKAYIIYQIHLKNRNVRLFSYISQWMILTILAGRTVDLHAACFRNTLHGLTHSVLSFQSSEDN